MPGSGQPPSPMALLVLGTIALVAVVALALGLLWVRRKHAQLDDLSRRIQEREQAGEDLRHTHQMLARTEGIANLGSWEWDIKTDTVRWSDTLFRIFQRDPARGAPSFAEHEQLYVAEDMEGLRAAADLCITQGIPYELELRAIRADGAIRHCIARGQAERDSQGRIHRLVGSLQDITERHTAQEELRANERYLQAILQTTIDGFWVIDADHRIIEVNQAYCDLLRYSRDELLGLTVAQIEALERPEDTARRIERIKREGSEVFLTKHRRKDGSTFPVEVSCSFLSEHGGRFVCFCRDLTERMQVQDRLALLARMLDHAPASITIHDTEGQFVYCNRQTLRLHGFENEEEFLSIPLTDLDVPESAALLAERFRLINEVGEARFESAHYRQDGSVVPLEILAKKMEWHGRPAVLSIATDITERKEAERAMRESEMRFEHLLNEVAMVSVQGYRLDGTTLYWNRGSEQLYGYSSDEAVGRNLLDLIIPPEMRAAVAEAIQVMAKTGEPIPASELELMRKDGSRIWVYSTHVMLPRRGQPPELFCIDVDLSEIKRGEAERTRLHEHLSQSQKLESIGRLAGGVAHDFNNMLGVILGHVELSLDDMDPADPLNASLQEIRAAARRSADLTGQLLAFARRQTVAPQVLNLNETVESMIRMLSRLIGEDIELQWKPGPDLDHVRMDPSQLDQVLANLCVNARDAIGQAGGTIRIETAHACLDPSFCAEHAGIQPGEYVLLAVGDNGCGMDHRTREMVFEPFYTTKGPGEGTGLGLATVYGIIKQNDGYIYVDSNPGQGSTFRIYLPCHAVPLVKEPEAPAERRVPPVAHETILVVEDETSILRMTRSMLERQGYTVLTASLPREALRLAAEHDGNLDLLIADVVMPEMNGRELTAELLSLHPDLKCLFMSGYTSNVIAHHGVLEDGLSFIQKPFSSQELAAAVRKTLETG